MKKYGLVLISLVLLLLGIMMEKLETGWFELTVTQFVWYVLALLPVGLPVYKEALNSIREKDFFNEYMLMGIAVIGAFYIGEYPEGVAVMLFYSIGELFQEDAVNKARYNISALLDTRPDIAVVIENGKPTERTPDSVNIGEIIEVKVGQRVPLDGESLSEMATFNTAALTGESLPRYVRKGDMVLAGMMAIGNTVRIKVAKPYNQSALSRILELVQNAVQHKAPAELFIRKLARVYTPIVTGLAALLVLIPYIYSVFQPDFIYLFNTWFYRALIFLVISCPCALVVSIPLGYFGGIGAASRHGILFKGGNYLDMITQINTFVFDKTGTLTKGIFEVQQVEIAKGVEEKELLCLAAAVESKSDHPIAKAIVSYVEKKGIEYGMANEITEIAGYGTKASVGKQKALVGNARLLEREGVVYPSNISAIPETTVLVAVNGRYAGSILLADVLKDDALYAIRQLEKAGIKDMRILSGDKQAIVSKVAGLLGISHAHGDLLPEEKLKLLLSLKTTKGNKVAFVGDGINDAPVLAASDLGIAMGGLGSDAAIETANVVIQTDQPSKIATAIHIGKMTRRIVWQNVILAFGVKLFVLALGSGGIATMWEAVFADVGVALIAILNAVRLQRIRL